jgi:hypothetical protein
MAKNKKKPEPIPETFATPEEAGAFWDTHSAADYWDRMRDVDMEIDIQSELFLVALIPDLADKLAQEAQRRGVSTETLVNVWLSEHLKGAA